MALLALKEVTIQFGGLTAVNKLSFEVEQGEILSLIGPNGAGKTTAFNAISGLYPPTSGEVCFSGETLQEPISPSVILRFVGVGILTGIFVLVALNLATLWENAIISNYTYLESFNWKLSFEKLVNTVCNLPYYWGITPLLLGSALGFYASLNFWRSARQSPERISRLGISRTFQNIRLFPSLTVLENLLVALEASTHSKGSLELLTSALRLPTHRAKNTQLKSKALEILNFVGLSALKDAPASTLPYGIQRRIEIARALACTPKLLLLDEPAAGLNPTESAELLDLIQKIRARGVTVVLIEHDMKVVMAISDRIVVLNYGNKIAEGTPEIIRKDPAVIEAYLGSSDHHV